MESPCRNTDASEPVRREKPTGENCFMIQLKSIYILDESIYETFYPLGTTPRTAQALA